MRVIAIVIASRFFCIPLAGARTHMIERGVYRCARLTEMIGVARAPHHYGTSCLYREQAYTVEPPIKDIPSKGHLSINTRPNSYYTSTF